MSEGAFWGLMAAVLGIGYVFLFISNKVIDIVLRWWDRRKVKGRLNKIVNQ